MVTFSDKLDAVTDAEHTLPAPSDEPQGAKLNVANTDAKKTADASPTPAATEPPARDPQTAATETLEEPAADPDASDNETDDGK